MTTVGQILKKQRENKGLTLFDVEKQIKIREKYLRAVEDNNWNYFSSKIYIVGILKNYSRLLGLDSKKILAFFRRDYDHHEDIKFKERISSSNLTPESKRVFRIITIISFLAIFSYFGYQLRLYFLPPNIMIISPKTIDFTTETKIKILGKTEKDTMVVINGNREYTNSNGEVEYDLFLKEGNNKIIIELTGANGKKTVVEKIFTKKSPE
jgi:cytoskeletal protein RodZ